MDARLAIHQNGDLMVYLLVYYFLQRGTRRDPQIWRTPHCPSLFLGGTTISANHFLKSEKQHIKNPLSKSSGRVGLLTARFTEAGK